MSETIRKELDEISLGHVMSGEWTALRTSPKAWCYNFVGFLFFARGLHQKTSQCTHRPIFFLSSESCRRGLENYFT